MTRKPSFFLVFAIIGILAAFIGFAKTFFIPMGEGKFKAPVAVHVHGFFAFSWIILFLFQTSLIHFRKVSIHRVLGYFGVIVAIGVSLTMVPAGLFQVQKELKEGISDTAYSNLIGVLTSGIMFLGFVVAGIVSRFKPGFHKRFMLLATIIVLWPAWFRFRHYFPAVPRPDIWFAVVLADSLILVSWIVDKATYGKIHPVLFYGGLIIIAEHIFEVLMFDNENWRALAKLIYNWIT